MMTWIGTRILAQVSLLLNGQGRQLCVWNCRGKTVNLNLFGPLKLVSLGCRRASETFVRGGYIITMVPIKRAS
jgi:hypothetical protein